MIEGRDQGQDEGTDGRRDDARSTSIRPSVQPVLTLIAAVARNGVIGRAGGLPWKLSGDLQRFKQATMGHPVIMGRKTWESIGRPLPGRLNVVVTRQTDYTAAGCTVVCSLAAAIAAAAPAAVAFVIGGAELYREALPLAQRLNLTIVEADVPGDALFPTLDRAQWRITSCRAYPADERNEWPCRVEMLERIGPNAV